MKRHRISKRFDFINPHAVFLSMCFIADSPFLCNFPSGFVRALGLFLRLPIKMCFVNKVVSQNNSVKPNYNIKSLSVSYRYLSKFLQNSFRKL